MPALMGSQDAARDSPTVTGRATGKKYSCFHVVCPLGKGEMVYCAYLVAPRWVRVHPTLSPSAARV